MRFLMPSRHNWLLKGQDTVFIALSMLSQKHRNQIRVETCAWGPDLARSQQLVSDLGLSDLVEFSPMLPRDELWNSMSQPNTVVIDQIPQIDFKGGIIRGSDSRFAFGGDSCHHPR